MTQTRRSTHRVALRARRTQKNRLLGRRLLAERLEDRHLLAGDVLISDFWNPQRPQDVNGDGHVSPLDALIVINELNQGGPRAIAGSAAPEGEQSQSTNDSYFYDVNNDGFVSPLDALIVINTLNGEGEGALMRYQIHAVVPGGDFTDPADAVTTLPVGEEYDLVVTVTDLRAGGMGVVAGFLDVFYDTNKTRVRVSEFQTVSLNGSPTGGSFTLTFDGQTTAPITFSSATAPSTIANRIRLALEGLSNVAPGDVEVSTTGAINQWQVRFKENLLDDVPEMTGDGTGLTGGTNPSVTVVTTANGVETNATAFREAFRSRLLPGIVDHVFYTDQLNAGNFPDRIDDLGAIWFETGEQGPFPLTFETELVRARMQATNGGELTFTADASDVLLGAHETLILGLSRVLTLDEIDLGTPVTLTIVADVIAGNDSVTMLEDTPAADAVTVINVLANDSTTLPGTLQVRSVNTAGVTGTVTFTNSTVKYVPAPNFYGQETFTYTIGVGASGGPTATATITVNVEPVNDAPVNSVPGTQSATEDTPFVFSAANSNAITVNDIDAEGNAIQVTLAATNGTLSLGSTANLTVAGNGSSNVLVSGTIADINAGLNGLTFTPALDFAGQAQLTVTTNDLGHTGDGGPQTDEDVITINVAGVNDAPINTVPGPQEVDEGTPLTFSSANSNAISVFDVDAGVANIEVTLAITENTGTLNVAAGGGVTIAGNGTDTLVLTGSQTAINALLNGLTFTPAAQFAGTTTLTVTTNDLGNTGTGGPLQDVSNVEIEVIAVSRPRAVNDTFGVAPQILEGSTGIVLDVMANDLPTTDAATTLESFTQPAVGQVTRDDNGTPADLTDDTLLYDPLDANFFGTVTFQYTINDTSGLGDDSTATVTVIITNVNDAPVAENDAYSTAEDTPLVVNAPGVLGNDSDVDNDYGGPLDPQTAVLVSQPANGSVVLNANGSFTYTPNANFFGTDSFTYRVQDGAGAESNVATVTLTVTAVNDPPTAVNDSYNATEDALLDVSAANGVLSNDTDIDSPHGSLEAILVSQASNGTVNLAADGSFTYQPNSNFFGTDSFTYQVRDDQGALSNVATVTLNVANVNDAPVAVNDAYNAVENTTLTVPAPGVLGNDTDIDSATLTAVLVTDVLPSQGTLTLNANGSFTFVPTSEFNGIATFQYQASDGSLLSNVATVTINVQEVNDPPTSVNDSYQTNEDVTLVVPAPGVLGNDTDPENDQLTAVLVSGIQPNQGTLTLNANGSFTYVPAANFFGTVTFTYRASDGLSQVPANVATVTITVNEVNDPPTAVDDNVQAFKDSTNTPVNVLANDSIAPDVNETISVTALIGTGSPGTTVTTAQGGTARLVGGQVFYDAPLGFAGQDSFQYEITDSRGGVAVATVFVTVVDAIPTDVGGRVYLDGNDNGNIDLGEAGLMGVTIRLVGTDIHGNTVNRTTVTDIGGFYFFANVAPGNYNLIQVQPSYMKDGKETAGGSWGTVSGNDTIQITLPQQGIAGGAFGNNFAERGIDAASLENSRGLLTEILASSGENGFILTTTLSGNFIWSWSLPGWDNMQSCEIVLDANLQSATLKVQDKAGTLHTIRIHQSPTENTESNYPSGSMARFRVLGWSSTGEYILRIDGTAADFGLNLLAATETGEGEGAYVRPRLCRSGRRRVRRRSLGLTAGRSPDASPAVVLQANRPGSTSRGFLLPGSRTPFGNAPLLAVAVGNL
jgi:hypothetical protein